MQALKNALEELNKQAQELGKAVYEQAGAGEQAGGQQQGGQAGGQGGGGDEDVIDAEYEVKE